MAVLSHCLAQAKRLSLLAVLSVFCLGLTLPAKAVCRDATAFGNSFEKQLKEEQPAGSQDACTGVWLDMDGQGRIGLFVGNNPINRIDPYGLAWYNPWSWGLWDSIANQVYPQPSTTVATPAPADPEDNVGNNTTAFSIQPPGVMQQAANESTQVGMAVPNGILNTAAMMLGPGEAEGAYAAADEALQAERAAATASKAAKAAEKCEKHHLLPRQFANNFKKVGLNPDDYTMDLPAAQHRLTPDGIHTGPAADSWNGQWSQFFQNNPNYTQQDVLNQLSSMQQQFGLK